MDDDKIMYILETRFPNIQSMNVEVLIQADDDYPESYITDTWHLVKRDKFEILRAMSQAESEGKRYLTDDNILQTLRRDCVQITWG